MSVSSLPEWKQLLLEKKRREEEERERRGKEEEEKLASMPAWKRGIIQRRKAKQESVCDKEKERDISLLQVDVRSFSDGQSDTDNSVTINLGSEPSLSPDPGQWLDADPKSASQVSVETIVPVHKNPFMRTQSAWKRGRDADIDTEPEIKETEKEKSSLRGQDGEVGRGGGIDLKIERFRDLSEGREKERHRDRSQIRERENSREGWEKDKSPRKESLKDVMWERELLKGRKDEEEKETDSPSGSFSPLVPSLRTIRADNIIIIEQDRKGSDERRGRWREAERERPEEDQQGKRAMKMDLREILASGGSVTEIRASEVLIIKPPVNPDERNTGGKARDDGDMKSSMDVRRESLGRELRTDISWLKEKEKEPIKEKERPWGQATVIKEDSKDSLDDVFVERGGRVSQLLSKFGQHPKPPSRSKSSDNFLRHGRRKFSGDEDEQQSEERKADGRNMLLKSVPRRSLSFSDRVICTKENGLREEWCYEGKLREKIHSNKSVAPWVDLAGLGTESTAKIKLGSAPLFDEDRFGRCRDGYVKNEDEKGSHLRRSVAEMCISVENRSEVKRLEPVDKRAAEKADDADGDEGFTVASVKNTVGISFARRVPIRQDGKARAEREVKRAIAEKSLEGELSVENDSEAEAQVSDKKVSDFLREDGFESAILLEAQHNYVMAASADRASACLAAESRYRHESAFTECSSLLCTVTERARDHHRGPEWSGTTSQRPYLTHSVLSQHTEEPISKIEKVGDTTVYSNERGERAFKTAHELTKECKQEGQHYSDATSESLTCDATPRSPKRIASLGISSGPLEIQIPRTVFYVAEEMVERKKTQDWEGGQGVERRDSWRIGKPLSRIESLREKIRQRELERSRQRETQEGEAAEISDAQTAGDRYDERGTETEREAAAHVQRAAEAERGQEDAAEQTSMAGSDVTQEVDMLKTYPQLPVSVSHSQAVRGEEVTIEYTTAPSESTTDSSQISEDEDDPQKHVEEQLKCHRGQQETIEGESDEEEGKELLEEEEEEYTSSLEPTESLSPSPPHPNSLAAMSRIYNLETVGSRSGLCLKERTVDVSSVQLVKVKPIISNAQQGDSKALTGDSGVQTIQRQIEQFQLKEQEVLKSSASPKTPLRDKDTKRQQSPRGVLKHQVKDDVKTREKDQPESNYKMSPHRVSSPTSQVKQTITLNSSFLKNQSPDNSLKPSDDAPTPASSRSSSSPASSPSVSQSPTPSPPLFSIKSASGGNVKRGATITINPKRHAAGGSGGEVMGSSTGAASAGSTSSKAPSQQPQTTTAVTEPPKKKYPTAEEIEVIGGYQNLEKSCLVKNRGTPKKVRVCFDEDQLEQVCEYPSETSMLVCTPYPHDLGRQQAEEVKEEEAGGEGGAVVSKSTRNVGTAAGQSTSLAHRSQSSPTFAHCDELTSIFLNNIVRCFATFE